MSSPLRECVLDTRFGRLTALRSGVAGAIPVLALHGWLDNAASFVPLAAHLPGIDLLALDMPGHGGSAHLPWAAEYTVVSAARAAFAAADALGWDRFVLLGHSLGAAVACAMAAAQPQRVQRLALIEAIGALTEVETRTGQRLRQAFGAQAAMVDKRLRVFPDIDTAVRVRMFANELDEPIARLLVERGLARVEGGFVWSSDPRLTLPTSVRMSEAQLRDLLAAIECPTRLVYAEPAFEFLPEALRRERLACVRNADAVGLAGGHHLHMDQPAEVAERLRTFLLMID